MLAAIKLALRITTTAFDSELSNLIDDCLAELAALGVIVPEQPEADMQILTAVIAYCKWLFGNNEDSDKWRAVYDRKLAQFKTMTGYTDWTGTEDADG